MLEIVDALAVDLESTPAFDAANRMPRPEEIIAFCSSLVTLNIRTKNVQLAHFSVRQYLFSERIEPPWKENLMDVVARISLARVCLAYCSSIQQDFDRDEHVKCPDKAMQMAFPFAKYASWNWSLYASVVEDHCEVLRAMILDFFLTRDQSFMNWLHLHNCYRDGRGDLNEIEALYWTSHEGLAVSVKILLDWGVSVNSESESGTYRHALIAAAANGHEKIVAMLLGSGADVNAGSQVNERTALALAAQGGYKTVVRMLLRHDADTCVWADEDSVLDLAIQGGDNDVIKMLLDQDLPGLIRDGSYSNGVLTAAEYAREEILQLLLRQRFGSNQIPPRKYSFALKIALDNLEYGYRDIAKILLEKGTTIDTTTFCRAVCGGHESTIQLLLDYDANIDDKALYTAVIIGHEGIVRTLVEKGANIEVKAFYAAMHQASVDSKELLLEPTGVLPLHLTPFQGSSSDFKKILQILTQRAVSDNLLYHASLHGDDSIVRKLLDAGADVHRQEKYYGNALQAASVEGHSKVVEMLLKAGADVNAEGGTCGNALQAASLRGYDVAWEMQEDKLQQDELQEDELQEDELQEDELEEDELEEDELEEDELPKDEWSEMEWILFMQKRRIRGLSLKVKLRKSVIPEGELQDRKRDGKRRERKPFRAGNYSQEYSSLFRDHAKVVAMLLAAGADPNAQGGRYGSALHAALKAGDDWILYQPRGSDPGPLQRKYFAIRDKIVESLIEAGATTTPEADEIVSRLRSSRRFRAQK